MPIKTPTFWYRRLSLTALLLSPLSLIYLLAHKIKTVTTKTYTSSLPVICVGNLVAGGSGKTPVALAIMNSVRTLSIAHNPVFLSRGYGGTIQEATRVDLVRHTLEETGDEPRLLARNAPTIVSPRRPDGARLAEESRFDLIVLDDGFQNPSLHKTISFVVIDGIAGFGNGLPLPAGPLRQTKREGFQNADAFILVGFDAHNVAAQLPINKPVFKARLSTQDFQTVQEAHYVAFCGLGRPEKFLNTIEEQGLALQGWYEFPDHHSYTIEELEALDQEANDKGARLLTTAKDAARLPINFAWQAPIDILNVAIAWDDEDALAAFLKNKIKSR